MTDGRPRSGPPSGDPDPATLQVALDAALASVRVRVHSHGGEVTARVTPTGGVEVEFHGACRGCPAKAFTYEAAVRPAIVALADAGDVQCRQIGLSGAARRRMREVIRCYEEAR